MKTALVAIFLFALLIPVHTFATDPTSITFTITSSARTTAPNLRIAVMTKKLANWSGRDVQAFALEGPFQNYWLTKSTTITIPKTLGTSSIGAWLIQTDQDTKMYLDDDNFNYMTIYADTPTGYTFK